jgi:hypothetical protein
LDSPVRRREMMKRALAVLMVLGLAGSVWAGTVNFPAGCTGLWLFPYQADNGPAKLKATFGADLTTSAAGNSYSYIGDSWTMIGYEPWNHGYYAGNGIVQERSWDYLTVNPRFTANGGGEYVNQYTVLVDYVQGTDGPVWNGDRYNSLFQTAYGGNDNDGELFIKCPEALGHTTSTIGVGDTGYSTLTFDASKWHRIVWSVDNGDDTGTGGFFRVYVDGTLFLDAPGKTELGETILGRDGRFSLYPDRFHLFADDSWEDAWGMVGTAATWNYALSGEEIAAMGGATYVEPSIYWTELWMGTPGDANLDGYVNELDGAILAANWGATTRDPFLYDSWWKMGDFNGDHKVDAADASILAANLGMPRPTEGAGGESAPVPEPSAAALLILSAALGLLARVRRSA